MYIFLEYIFTGIQYIIDAYRYGRTAGANIYIYTVTFARDVDTTFCSSDGNKRIVKMYYNIPFERREENGFFKRRVGRLGGFDHDSFTNAIPNNIL